MFTSVMSTKHKISCLFVVIILLFFYILFYLSRRSPYNVWREKQEILKTNIKSVCENYGASLRLKVPMSEFMYSSENNLLFCRNAKVKLHCERIHSSFTIGWNDIMAEELFVYLLRISSSAQIIED